MERMFIELLQVSLGTRDRLSWVPTEREWEDVYEEAWRQAMVGVLLDGLERLAVSGEGLADCLVNLPLDLKLEWIGESQMEEAQYESQQEAAERLARLYAENDLRTYVLKGAVIAECYPVPQYRCSVDFDCYLQSMKGKSDAWEYGNQIVENLGEKVNRDFYKNSKFTIWGLTVENHQYLTPFRGNERLKALERFLQHQLTANSLESEISQFEGTELWRPPVMVSALFLIEHAYSHFLHEGLTWRHVLDWQMFIRKHREDINWKELDVRIDEFGFRLFYDTYCRIGLLAMGQLSEESLTIRDKRMLADIWSPLDVHKTVNGLRGKLALAGNTWRARWKYSEFTDMTWLRALWIQVRGYLFDKNPKI